MVGNCYQNVKPRFYADFILVYGAFVGALLHWEYYGSVLLASSSIAARQKVLQGSLYKWCSGQWEEKEYDTNIIPYGMTPIYQVR